MIVGIDGNEANQVNKVGIGQFAYNVLFQLEKLDKENQYFIYLKEKPLFDLPKERKGWKYFVFGPKKFWTQIALPLKLFSQRHKLNVFYSPSHYAPRYSPFPTIISIMDLWHHRHPEQFAKKDLYTLKKWEAYSVKNSSNIITISEFSKSEILKYYNYPKEKIVVAYPGFNQYRVFASRNSFGMQSIEYRVDEVKKKYKITGNYILYLGTLQPKKNIEGLIKAFAILITNYQSPITLVIAGKKGWLFEKIFDLVKELKLEERVVFTDFVEEEDKPYLIAGSQAFVMPSFYEGFGIPVAEAMSLGIPVACSGEGSLTEVGGEAVFYFNPYDIKDIAQALGKVLSLNKAEIDEIIKKGKSQSHKFSWEDCTKKILEVFKTYKQA